MCDQFSNTQAIRKPAVTSKGGIVAAQSSKAAQVGAEVLAAGGDCVDAVIATTFALGVLEPWMSGLGGGGTMVLNLSANWEKTYPDLVQTREEGWLISPIQSWEQLVAFARQFSQLTYAGS